MINPESQFNDINIEKMRPENSLTHKIAPEPQSDFKPKNLSNASEAVKIPADIKRLQKAKAAAIKADLERKEQNKTRAKKAQNNFVKLLRLLNFAIARSSSRE